MWYELERAEISILPPTARTIVRQAWLLGYQVLYDRAQTGSVYLRLTHPALCQCGEQECGGRCAPRLVRVSDHAPNPGRWAAEADPGRALLVEVGHQEGAVRKLAEWIGRRPESVPYLRRCDTLRRRRQQAAEAAQAAQQAASARLQAAQEAAWASLSEEHRAVLDEYARLSGRARKRFRQTGRYRAAVAALESLVRALAGHGEGP